jgi:hypothetical protein
MVRSKPDAATADIRKIVGFVDETRIEGGRKAEPPLRLAACAAVVRNPWAGVEFVEDLVPVIHAISPLLAAALIPRLMSYFPSADAVAAFGKAAIVGINGEIEHAAGLIHTLHFGNAFRVAANANGYLPFTNKRGGAGCAITVPLEHKREEKRGSRSHYLTIEFAIPDAPGPDEIIVAIGAADGGRPHHRIGDRFRDMKEMRTDQTGMALGSSRPRRPTLF